MVPLILIFSAQTHQFNMSEVKTLSYHLIFIT